MNLYEVEELNKSILTKASTKLKDKMAMGEWDDEVFEAMCDSIDNLKDISKKRRNEEMKEATETKTMYAKTWEKEYKETEFEKLIYALMDKKSLKDVMCALTKILNEHIEDTRVMHPKAYENIMLKLKEML